MKSTGLLIAAALLAVLTGVLYWSNHHKTEDAKTSGTPAATKLLSFKDAEVTKIEIDKKGTEQVELAKGSDGKWAITAPRSLTGDQDAITGVISVLSGLNSEQVVEDQAATARFKLGHRLRQVQFADRLFQSAHFQPLAQFGRQRIGNEFDELLDGRPHDLSQQVLRQSLGQPVEGQHLAAGLCVGVAD